MANRYLADMKLTHQDSESADTALSVFEGFLQKQNIEKAQNSLANDAEMGSLSYLFGIFN